MAVERTDRAGADGFLPLPTVGRVFTAHLQVRLGDVTPRRRARLDAVARYLQDVAEDDAADAGWPPDVGWVVRWTRVSIRRFPRLGERLRLDTFCSGTAAAWAERTTTIAGDGGASLQGTSVWVAVRARSGRPARLGDRFDAVYAPSAGGRRATARLHLPPPTPAVRRAGRDWPLRTSDFDAWGHLNNAISWAAVEDALADEAEPAPSTNPGPPPFSAVVEHHRAIEPGDRPVLCRSADGTTLSAWLVDRRGVLTAARVEGRAWTS
jgi:acyl-ACP thioesterase